MNKGILNKKTCFITGASRGFGKSLALQLAKCGCNLILTSRNESKLEEVKQELELLNNTIGIKLIPGELESKKDLIRMADEAKQAYDSIDIIINNAGVFPVKQMADSSIEDFDTCFNVNVRAPFYFMREFSAKMISNKWGRIVNVGSSSAYAGFSGTSLYCSSKHALLGLSRSSFNEMKEHNVRTYFFAPGSMKTEMGRLVKNQDYNTFIEPDELSELICEIISYNGNMVSEEIRFNRMFIQ